MKYVILGFPNSGSHSLEAYLKSQGHDVVLAEDKWRRPNVYLKNWPDRKPIFITRLDNHHLQHMDHNKKLKTGFALIWRINPDKLFISSELPIA